MASPHRRAQVNAGGVMPTVKLKLANALHENANGVELPNNQLTGLDAMADTAKVNADPKLIKKPEQDR